MNPLLSVIIPTYHRNDLLAMCLDRLRPGVQQLNSAAYEVIVSDDGREFTAQQMIADAYSWVRWVQGPQKGPAANRNAGVKLAKGKWLVFTDDDCLPDAGWLAAYVEAIKARTKIRVFEGRTIANRPRQRYDEEAPINETGGNLWSCNLCICKSLFKQLKGFDEGFPFAAMEDIDLHTRLINNSIKTFFISSAVIVHPYRITNWRNYQKTYESVVYFWNKHGGMSGRYRLGQIKHILYSLSKNLILLIKFQFRGWFVFIKEHQHLIRTLFIPTNHV